MTGNLSLAQLGERLGVSKALAADIVCDFNQTTRPVPPEVWPVVAAYCPVLAYIHRDHERYVR